MELLRFVTAGNVDDGKSTLIGRLLYDSKSIFEDTLEDIKRSSAKYGDDEMNLALLTDGLRSEREQGITIDVAYRFFSTPRRKFIIIDAPGHAQYTRNMITGASHASLAVVLVDATRGLQEQTRRHTFLTSLLQIRHLVVCVNKMDLVDYDFNAFNRVINEFRAFAPKLDLHEVTFIPVSALKGDNVVTKSAAMPWYQGPALLPFLEEVYTASDTNLRDFRFPVQGILKNTKGPRAYTGNIASGTIQKGDEVMVLPSQLKTRVKSVSTFDGELSEAFAPMAVAITLEDEIDIDRGDMIVKAHNVPEVSQNFDATICWLSTKPYDSNSRLILRHTTSKAKCAVEKIFYRIDVNTLHRMPGATELRANDIAKVAIKTSKPLFFDSYRENRLTGCGILIDEVSGATVASVVIL